MPLSRKPDRAVHAPIRGYAMGQDHFRRHHPNPAEPDSGSGPAAAARVPKRRCAVGPPSLDVVAHSFGTRHP